MFIAISLVVGVVWGWAACSFYREARMHKELNNEWVDFLRTIASNDEQ